MSEKETTLDLKFSQVQVLENPYDARGYQIVVEKDSPKTKEAERIVKIFQKYHKTS